MAETHALARRFQSPKLLAESIAAGLAVVGVVCLFQPSSLAKTFSIASFLASGSTLGLTRFNHRLYVEIAYRHATELGDRHEAAKRQLEQSIADFQAHAKGQSAQFQQTLEQMQQSLQGYVLMESELRHTNEELQGLVAQAEQETKQISDRLHMAEATLEQTQQAQQQFFTGLKATVEESITDWVNKIETLCEQLSKRCPELENRVEQILSDLSDRQTFYSEAVAELSVEASMMEALDQVISLLHSIYDQFGVLRIQALNASHIRQKQMLLSQATELQNENQQLNSRDVVSRQQLEQVIGNYEAALREFRDSYTQHAQETLQFAGEIEQTVVGQDPVFEKMQFLLQHQELQISKLELRLKEANQIRTF
jgi:chromosome segregation ATPase